MLNIAHIETQRTQSLEDASMVYAGRVILEYLETAVSGQGGCEKNNHENPVYPV